MRLQIREHLLYWLLRLLKRVDRRDCGVTAFDPEQVRSILLVSSTALGDAALSTAAIAAVRQRYPHAHLVGLFNRAYLPLFAAMPELDAALGCSGGYRDLWTTTSRLRRHRPDLALILHGNEPQATPLAYLSGAHFIFKLPNTSRFRFLLANSATVVPWSRLGHGLDQRLAVAALADARIPAHMHVPEPAGTARHVEDWLRAHDCDAATPLIGLQLGASSAGRMWPGERFAALMAALVRQYPRTRFVLTGSPAEVGHCLEVAATAPGRACVAAGALDLTCLPALLARCNCIVSGDTGTMHLAVAVGTPVVALFAVSDPATSGPAYDLDRHVVIYRPCPDLALNSKSGDQGCIARITAEEVRLGVTHVLERQQHEAHSSA